MFMSVVGIWDAVFQIARLPIRRNPFSVQDSERIKENQQKTKENFTKNVRNN